MNPKRIVLRFSPAVVDKPIIYRLARDFDLVFNILKANITPQKEGTLVMELSGERYQEGLDFLRNQGVAVQPLSEEIVRNEEKCTMCGACTVFCPTGALYMERPSMVVRFNEDDCVVCQLCTRACPVRAMEARF
jgi:ferredoxin